MPKNITQNVTFGKTRLNLINNNVDKVVENRKDESSKTTARKRWKILAKALFKDVQEEVADVSVRRFTSFGVFSPASQVERWAEYSTADGKYSLSIQHLQSTFSARDLMGFNNTGNICVWPSEETLAIYITSNLEFFNDKTVLELGGGMSCMAGLIAAKYARVAHVHVTDGNIKSIENVQAIIKKNMLQEIVSCSVLQWESVKEDPESPALIGYQIILVADCLFFDEVREDLIQTIRKHLADSGVAYVMAPQRGNTLNEFIKKSECLGFVCTKDEKYNFVIWERHLELLNSNVNYDPSLHYPILLQMTKVI